MVTEEGVIGFDGDLVGRTRAALDAWEASRGGPTSALTGSGAVELLERRFAELCGVRHALALPTGTLALRFALAAVGVRRDDEVLVPALDWPAAVAATLSLSAHPRPVDVAKGSFSIDPTAVATRISPRTRAVVVTHLAGVPVEMDPIRSICDERGVPVVEDASQALGAEVGDRSVGGLGAVGVFSLGPEKLVDAGEGGILVTDDAGVHREAVRLSQSPVRQLLAGLRPPDLTALAARVHPLATIVALWELDDLDAKLARRRARADDIRDRARGLAGVSLPEEAPLRRFSWSCTPALVSIGEEKGLARAGLVGDPLGAHLISEVIGEEAQLTPNARETLPLLRRLHSDDRG